MKKVQDMLTPDDLVRIKVLEKKMNAAKSRRDYNQYKREIAYLLKIALLNYKNEEKEKSACS